MMDNDKGTNTTDLLGLCLSILFTTAKIQAASSYEPVSAPGGVTDAFPFLSDGTRKATLRPGRRGNCFWILAGNCWVDGALRAGSTRVRPPLAAEEAAGTDFPLGAVVDAEACGAVDDSRVRFGRCSAEIIR
jgi:hypothetical protein